METKQTSKATGFDALDLMLDLLRRLRVVFAALERVDGNLADQMKRAAQSVALNLGEGRGRRGRDQRRLWRYAFGSAEELEAGLLTAEAMGYLEAGEIADILALLDRLHAMCWRLSV